MPFIKSIWKQQATGRRLRLLIIASALILLLSWFTLTSPRASLPLIAAPTAEEVGAVRAAYKQLREGSGSATAGRVTLGQSELSSLAALASHALRPNRIAIVTARATLRIEASRPLIMGRWLNVAIDFQSPSIGFPEVRLTVGSVRLPPLISRAVLEVARWFFILTGRADIPRIGQTVRKFAVHKGGVSAMLSIGSKSGIVDAVAGMVSRPVDRGAVIRIYCGLVAQQRRLPSAELVEQVHRAFSLERSNAHAADVNRAAFLALGMLLVDDRMASFARLRPNDLRHCSIAPVPVTIYGRFDWPKHWALSAALSVVAGSQLSETAGEWKELADSLSRQSRFAIGDPTGFSMADLAADRAGYRLAASAVEPARAEPIARKLAVVKAEQLLPHRLTEHEDGLSNADFVRRYGGADDPRFQARIRHIDLILFHSGIR